MNEYSTYTYGYLRNAPAITVGYFYKRHATLYGVGAWLVYSSGAVAILLCVAFIALLSAILVALPAGLWVVAHIIA